MIENKQFLYDIYHNAFFADVELTKSLKKFSIYKLQDKFEALVEFEEENPLSDDKDSNIYRKYLYSICRNVVAMQNKKLQKSNRKTYFEIMDEVTKRVKKLCDFDLDIFEKEYPDVKIETIFEKVTDLTILQRKSLIGFYTGHYLPYYIKKDISKMMKKNPEDEYPDTRNMIRHFILHIGPTNSGKTYEALERLKQCQKGAYFGPLRLLALEVYDKFNWSEVPCNMITGEEELRVPDARCQASTIEMLNENDYYDIVVVDEVQMLADPFRGYNWTKAILGLKASEIHLCMAPEAEEMVINLINRCKDTYEIKRHERKTELVFDDSDFDLKDIQQGDALIVFSKKSVLALAAELQRQNIKASIIYGNLPPATRRHQVEMFTNGETKVVVSTDAIGMGLNLPIQRVIFMETTKFDGVQQRKLYPPEIKQIAGRAGRMGMYDKGYVLSVSDRRYFKESLTIPNEALDHVYIGFPENVLSLPFKLDELLKTWASLDCPDIYKRMNVEELLDMYNAFANKNDINNFSKEEIYNLITCPIDSDNFDLMTLWLFYCKNYKDVSEFDVPKINVDYAELNELETHYKELDLYFQFSRKTKKTINVEELNQEKEVTVQKINKILAEESKKFIKRCSRCRKPLDYNFKYKVCQNCYRKIYYYK